MGCFWFPAQQFIRWSFHAGQGVRDCINIFSRAHPLLLFSEKPHIPCSDDGWQDPILQTRVACKWYRTVYWWWPCPCIVPIGQTCGARRIDASPCSAENIYTVCQSRYKGMKSIYLAKEKPRTRHHPLFSVCCSQLLPPPKPASWSYTQKPYIHTLYYSVHACPGLCTTRANTDHIIRRNMGWPVSCDLQDTQNKHHSVHAAS